MCVRGKVDGHSRAVIGAPATVAGGAGLAATSPRAGARYLRITRGRLGEADLARSRSRPGCRGASAGLDSESGALVVITWWDTREQAQGAGDGPPPGAVRGVPCELPEIYEASPAAG
jgi:hypothetical protein